MIVWNATTGQKVTQMKPGGQIRSMAPSPDGQWLVSINRAAGDFSEVWVWELAAGRAVARMEHPVGPPFVAFGPDGKRVASAGSDDTVWLWRPEDVVIHPDLPARDE